MTSFLIILSSLYCVGIHSGAAPHDAGEETKEFAALLLDYFVEYKLDRAARSLHAALPPDWFGQGENIFRPTGGAALDHDAVAEPDVSEVSEDARQFIRTVTEMVAGAGYDMQAVQTVLPSIFNVNAGGGGGDGGGVTRGEDSESAYTQKSQGEEAIAATLDESMLATKAGKL